MQLGCVFFSRQREGSVAAVGSVLGREGLACRWSGRFFLGGREVQLQQWLLLLFLGERKSHPFSLLVFIAPVSVLGCLGTGPRLSLPPF